jgi:quercetin 2,3-dioxygenase
MKATTVKQLVKGMPASDGAGVKLKRVIGQPALPRLDPFLMLDEFGSDQAEDYLAGFPPHPHRGFQTVTYMLTGKMRHKDSVGNEGIIEDGGLQWMNAGKGIIHEEMPMQTEGEMRGFQLWVNLPASEKMSAPGYEDIDSSKISELKLGENVTARVLAGELLGIEGAVSTQTVHPQFYDIHVESDATINLAVNEGHNGFVYIYEGEITLADTSVKKGQLAVLDFGNHLEISVTEQTKFIFVSGQPIGEPIEQYGPFVMNTRSEIEQAINDYNQGRLTD